MVQFIHLCLLLGLSCSYAAATCKLLLSSETVDILQQLCSAATTLPLCKTIKQGSSSNYLCCEVSNSKQDGSVCLNVTNDCIQPFCVDFSKLQTINNKDCKETCTTTQNCQYCTFNVRDDTSCLTSLTSTTWSNIVNMSGNCCIHSNGLQFHPEAKTWIDALEYCRTNNSSLVQITNTTVKDTVNQLLQLTEDLQEGVWIGLERPIFSCASTSWKWVSGENVENNLINSSPVNTGNNYCGKITKDGLTQPEDCFKTLPFICQS